MNISSGSFAAGVDEFDEAGLEKLASESVRSPRVGGAPASFECKLLEIKALVDLDGNRLARELVRWCGFISMPTTSPMGCSTLQRQGLSPGAAIVATMWRSHRGSRCCGRLSDSKVSLSAVAEAALILSKIGRDRGAGQAIDSVFFKSSRLV